MVPAVNPNQELVRAFHHPKAKPAPPAMCTKGPICRPAAFNTSVTLIIERAALVQMASDARASGDDLPF